MISWPGPEIMAVEYKFYRPKRILNRHKHPLCLETVPAADP